MFDMKVNGTWKRCRHGCLSEPCFEAGAGVLSGTYTKMVGRTTTLYLSVIEPFFSLLKTYWQDCEYFLQNFCCKKIGDSVLKVITLICAVILVSHWFACGYES